MQKKIAITKKYPLLCLFICTTLFAFGQIQNPKVMWRFKTQGTIRGSATASSEKVYFGSADGNFYALNKSTGALLWKFESGGAIANTPALTSSLVIFYNRAGQVYALNAQSGLVVWKFQMEPIVDAYWQWEYFTAAPVIDGKTVYVGSGDSHLYALNIESGKPLWKFKTNGRIRATPLIENDLIYQPSNDGVVYVIQARSGKLLWKFETEGSTLDSRKFGFDRNCIFARPILTDSMLIIASRDGKVYGVDRFDHKEKWRFTYGPTWAMATSYEQGVVFVGWSTNNHVCAIDTRTGKERWKFVANGVNYTSPLILERDIIVGSSDEHLYALDKKTGKKSWEYKVDAPIFSTPIFSEGTIYFGSDDGNLYALEEGIKPLKAVYQPVPGRLDLTVDQKITSFLKTKGFLHIDSIGITRFVSERIKDKKPSVIVMGFDLFPKNLIGEKPEKGLLRQYLEAGGKILWFGNTPNFFYFDEDKKFVVDVDTPNRLLDVEFVRTEESGNYFARATQEGMNYGLPVWFTTTFGNISPKNITTLAIDEYGRVGAWVKKFSDRPGSGFVSCRMWGWDAPLHDEHLDLIYKLAMYQLE